MSEEHIISRITILFQQQKFSDAEILLKDLLSQEPNNTHYLHLLAEAKLQQDKFEEAEAIIDNAIGLAPDDANLFYVKARIALQQERMDDAEMLVTQAIALDPYDADYFALMSNIKLQRKDYETALQMADEGLQIDAENLMALNSRSAALIKLNRSEESFQTIEGALREDPNNAYTHANYGWGLLEKGNHKKALYHFKESLQNDPNYEYAQAGLLEALKARNIFYRWFLKYSFWIGNFTSKYQWGVIIGFYLVVRLIRSMATANETVRPYLTPIIVLLTIVAFSTWIMGPIGNLFLRFNKYGQLLLDKKEKLSSNLVAMSVLILMGGLAAYFLLKVEAYILVAAYGFAMMVPYGVMFSPSKPKYALVIYSIALAVLGLLAIYTGFTTGNILNVSTSIFGIAFLAFQFIVNFMVIKQSNR